MTTSRKNSVLSQIESDDPIPAGTMSYLCERVRNSYFDFVLSKYRLAEKEGLTKAKLARRIGKTPDRVSHMLGAPGNWTTDTATELLVGICREELTPMSVPFAGRPARNRRPSDLLCHSEPSTTAYQILITPENGAIASPSGSPESNVTFIKKSDNYHV